MKRPGANSVLVCLSVVLGVGSALLTIHGCENRDEAYVPVVLGPISGGTPEAPTNPPDLIQEPAPAAAVPETAAATAETVAPSSPAPAPQPAAAPATVPMIETAPALVPVLPSPTQTIAVEPDEADVLTRGRLHEAYGELIAYNPQPGIIITKAPPAPVEELPPEMKPAGNNVIWIPGYWWWDEEQNDFVWISGLWRDAPPDCEWVPGYWTPVANGYQWVSGFWKRKNVGVVQYLPAPPASLESGPSSAAPGPDYLWVPGTWVYVGGRYVWQAGGWMIARADWVWVPPHYLWTPRGYVYVAGYWDYPFERRGVIFAPVRFRPKTFVRPVVLYRPTVVIETSVLTVCLFSRPAYGYYYFGNYFEVRFTTMGIVPWFWRHHHDHRWHDPVLVHYQWDRRRHDPHWEDRLRRDYDYRYLHADARPPITLAGQRKLALEPRAAQTVSTPTLAAPLRATATGQRTASVRAPLTPLNRTDQEMAAAHGKMVLHHARERQKLEATATPAAPITVPRQVQTPRQESSRVESQKLVRPTAPAAAPEATTGPATLGKPAVRTTPTAPTTTPIRPTRGVPEQPAQTTEPTPTVAPTTPTEPTEPTRMHPVQPHGAARSTPPTVRPPASITTRNTAPQADQPTPNAVQPAPNNVLPTRARPAPVTTAPPAAATKTPTAPKSTTQPTTAPTATAPKVRTDSTAAPTPTTPPAEPEVTAPTVRLQPRPRPNVVQTPEANTVQPSPAQTMAPAANRAIPQTPRPAPTPAPVAPTQPKTTPTPTPRPQLAPQPVPEPTPTPTSVPSPTVRPNVTPRPINITPQPIPVPAAEEKEEEPLRPSNRARR
jgi:hypothetical protein